MPLETGARLGPFQIEGVIGEGGMGTVYVAVQQGLGRRVALKVRSDRGDNEEAAQRFAREAVAASKVRHPGVVEIYDAGVEDGHAWIAMELLEGETLGARLRRGKLSPGEVVWLADQTLAALAVVHEEGLVHRDLKPENLFLERVRGEDEARLKILDFGIATGREAGLDAITRTGSTVGTPWYLSPEQGRGAELGPESDIYSLGVVLYECLVGARPFEAASFGDLVVKIATEAPPPLTERASEVPEALAAIIHRALASRPPERFADARQMRAELRALGVQAEPLAALVADSERPPIATTEALPLTPSASATEPGSLSRTLAMGSATPAPDPFGAADAPLVMSPTSRPSGSSKKKVGFVAGAAALLLLGGLGLFVLGDGAVALGGPGPSSRALSETTWASPADPLTGYQPLASVFDGVEVHAAAANDEGVFVVATRRGGHSRLLIWRDGTLELRALESPETAAHYPLGAVSALALDSAGRIYAGTRRGRLIVFSPDGEVLARNVVDGTTITDLALSPDGETLAMMMSGGEVRLVALPVADQAIDPLRMPHRARLRRLAYLPDGRLMVGGDAGAVFFREDGEWKSLPIAAGNEVRALGVDRDGRPLAADRRGLIHANLGARWRQIGDVPSTPAAIRDTEAHGVLVLGESGRLFATLEGEAFAEMPGYRSPLAEDARVHGALIAGPNAVFWHPAGLFVFDGGERLFRSDEAHALRLPEGISLDRCHLHPVASRLPSGPPPIFVCEGQLARFGAGGLEPLTEASFGALTHPAAVWVDLEADLFDHAFDWLEGTLVRAADERLERWDPSARRWAQIGSHPEGLSWHRVATRGDAVFAVDREHVVHHGRFIDGALVLEPLGRSIEPEDWRCRGAALEAIGPGRALLLRCGRVTQLTVGAEPVPWEGPRLTTLARLGEEVIAMDLDSGLHRIDAEGVSHAFAIEGRLRGSPSPVTYAAHAGGLELAIGHDFGAALWRCAEGRCRERALPAGVVPRGVLGLDEQLLVITTEGIGLLPTDLGAD